MNLIFEFNFEIENFSFLIKVLDLILGDIRGKLPNPIFGNILIRF